MDLSRLERAPFVEEVHDLLLEWRVGQDAPEVLTRYAGRRFGIEKERSPAPEQPQRKSPAKPRRAAEPDLLAQVKWRPVSAQFAPAATRQRDLESLYDELSKSVYVVVAARASEDLRTRKSLAQGSAVAIDADTLITNCHIMQGRPMVYLATQDGLVRINVVAARGSADTCVLGVKNQRLSPVARVRSFNSLKVGEPVIAIGSPRGFTNTLSAGIISQLREREGQNLIQTTAPISGGSSGGGLFDQKGNLVGITTFAIREAENLNFAIAIDEYQ